jgi:hypothetical protein
MLMINSPLYIEYHLCCYQSICLDRFVADFIDQIFRMFNDLIDDKTCSAIGRDCCLDLIVKFVDRAHGCYWTSKFILSGIE